MGLARLAEDERVARDARERAHRAALDRSPRCAARRWRSSREVERRAARDGHLQVVEGGAARRLPRLQPERQGPDDVLGLLRPAAARRARLDAARAGTRSPRATRADFTVLTVPGRFAAIGDPHAGMDQAAGSLDELLELAARDEARGLGDAPWPPHFQKMDGEAPRVAPSRAKKASRRRRAKRSGPPAGAKMPLLVVANSPDKQAALAGLERWKAAAPRGGRAPRRRRRPGRLDAWALVDLDAHPRQPAARPGGRTARPGDARSRRRPDRRVARDAPVEAQAPEILTARTPRTVLGVLAVFSSLFSLRSQRRGSPAKISASSCAGTTSSCA